ncbi:similar to class II cytokine receptor 12 (predicted), isoform CRA_b [Rattus norvegicus]|uniref:Similar to class II cytokine receptor 12 (Predicted), isoform CRA_b n=1 Tax=Rattus norvegicus TaxID=10116 RepID=A6IT63_RAT|nr:similar to class II cytokine receptor 12 (predicted), isoform CRA_b [Rattus norvegicus]
MWRAGRWAPLLLFLMQSALGRPRLAPPRNVTLLSQNFTVYLTWLPGLGSPPNVTYFVTYKSYNNHWRRVEHCAGISTLVCPMMCLKKQDLYIKFKGRVQAASAHVKSPWVESSGASPTHPGALPEGEDPKCQRYLPAATLHASVTGTEVPGGVLEGGPEKQDPVSRHSIWPASEDSSPARCSWTPLLQRQNRLYLNPHEVQPVL